MTSPFVRAEAGETWFQEASFKGTSTRLKIDRLIHHETGLQDVLVFENEAFGRVLALDGVIQVTSSDEHIYHEMMAHAPILAHDKAKHVLIIGGGDGGILREVLRHKDVKSVTLVEIDGSVIETCRKHMPEISAGAFDDPRAHIQIEDGAAYVRNAKDKFFDLIVVDSSDPEGPAEVLFSLEFYAHCERLLNKHGLMISQNGVPFLQFDPVAEAFANLREAFADGAVNALQITVPSYTGGQMLLGLCSKRDSLEMDLERLNRRYDKLDFVPKHYTPGQYLAGLNLTPLHMALVFGLADED